MTQTITQEAIALLIELAEKGEIDPWDVQVIEVVDRFLAHLISNDRKQLYESGQALLYASMLVLLKANTLSHTLHPSEPEQPEDIDPPEPLPIDYLKHIRRRPVAPQSRSITLAELIQELEQISQLVAPVRPPTRPKANKISHRAAAKMIKQLAHSENLSEMANSLEQYFQHHPLEAVNIRTLGQHFNDLVGVFWALLLLSAQGKVEVYQTDFYGEITVVPCI